MNSVRVWLLGALLLQVPSKCGQEPPGPEIAYRTFAQAANMANAPVAWSLLSKETRAELDRRAAAVAAAQNGARPLDGKTMAFGEPLLAPREIKSVAVTPEGKDRARLVVTDSTGDVQSIVTVFEEGQWRVDLMDELRKSKK
jgi:hypothetical protein